jgi:hypothetical protein
MKRNGVGAAAGGGGEEIIMISASQKGYMLYGAPEDPACLPAGRLLCFALLESDSEREERERKFQPPHDFGGGEGGQTASAVIR